MELQDRIYNIKRLLEFCPRSTAEVHIVEEKVGLFFAKLFNNDERFQHTRYDHVYPRIYLCEELNTDYETHSTTIGIEYTYEADRDGEYLESYRFNDEDLKDSWYYNNLKLTYIEYSEVPDDIWEIIQNKLYEEATKSVNGELASAKKSVEYWENRLSEFKNNLDLR